MECDFEYNEAKLYNWKWCLWQYSIDAYGNRS